MSNSQITSQLTRVTVPSISDGKFADGIKNAFETINNNFKTIASLPFIQGVQGDSYTLISKDIWLENETSDYTLSKEGAVLLNSIFERFFLENKDDTDTKKFQEGDSFDECKTNILGGLNLNGVSPLDSFFTEEIEENKTVEKLVNNKLYFYSVINNLDEEQDTYLGQYFYFIDYRITELGNAYQNKNLSEFIDFTGFYQYQPASENEPEKYNVISIVPNLYYDKYKDDICWKYNGQETGISAMGPKGLDGKDANFKIVYVKYENDTNNSGKILGYFNSTNGTIEYTETLEDCFCLIQFVDVVTNEDNTNKNYIYRDFAFGEVHENNAYWQDSLKIGKLFNNQNITRYFCSMGNDDSGIENHPYYFAIPAYLDRSEANTYEYKVGHVFSGSDEGNLVLRKADNAFTEAGGQASLDDLNINNIQGKFDIQNYDVNIGKELSVTGTAKFNNKIFIDGETSVSDNLYIGVDLSVSNNVGISGDLGVTGSATVGGDLDVNGTASFNNEIFIGGETKIENDLYINGNLDVNGTANFNETVNIIGTPYDSTNHPGLIVEGGNGGNETDEFGGVGLIVRGGTVSIPDSGELRTTGLGLRVETGGAVINNDLTVGETLDVVGTAIFEGGVTIDGNETSELGGVSLIVEGGNYENSSGIGYGGVGIDVCGGEYWGGAGGTGGTGIIVKGGDDHHTGGGYGYGGAGLYVEGGSGTIGGTGIIVKGGTDSEGDCGQAIVAHGDIIICDKSGGNQTKFSSNSTGLEINKHTTITSGATINNGVSITNGLYAITKKPTISQVDGNADGISNVLVGHNNPGNVYEFNDWTGDFPKDLTKGGYPLVIQAYERDGSGILDSALVIGPSDIYSLTKKEDGTYGPGTLCLQDRTGYSGKTEIGGELEVKGGAKINRTISSEVNFSSYTFPNNDSTFEWNISGEYTTNVLQVDMNNSGGGCKVQIVLPTMTVDDNGKIFIIHGQAINTNSNDKPDWVVEGIENFSFEDKKLYTLIVMYCNSLSDVGHSKWILLNLDARD